MMEKGVEEESSFYHLNGADKMLIIRNHFFVLNSYY